LALAAVGRHAWHNTDPAGFGLFLGVLGWFVQGLGEFSLYVPALAWTAFTLLGCLLAETTRIPHGSPPGVNSRAGFLHHKT
jgi:hypothetical protein